MMTLEDYEQAVQYDDKVKVAGFDCDGILRGISSLIPGETLSNYPQLTLQLMAQAKSSPSRNSGQSCALASASALSSSAGTCTTRPTSKNSPSPTPPTVTEILSRESTPRVIEGYHGRKKAGREQPRMACRFSWWTFWTRRLCSRLRLVREDF